MGQLFSAPPPPENPPPTTVGASERRTRLHRQMAAASAADTEMESVGDFGRGGSWGSRSESFAAAERQRQQWRLEAELEHQFDLLDEAQHQEQGGAGPPPPLFEHQQQQSASIQIPDSRRQRTQTTVNTPESNNINLIYQQQQLQNQQFWFSQSLDAATRHQVQIPRQQSNNQYHQPLTSMMASQQQTPPQSAFDQHQISTKRLEWANMMMEVESSPSPQQQNPNLSPIQPQPLPQQTPVTPTSRAERLQKMFLRSHRPTGGVSPTTTPGQIPSRALGGAGSGQQVGGVSGQHLGGVPGAGKHLQGHHPHLQHQISAPSAPVRSPQRSVFSPTSGNVGGGGGGGGLFSFNRFFHHHHHHQSPHHQQKPSEQVSPHQTSSSPFSGSGTPSPLTISPPTTTASGGHFVPHQMASPTATNTQQQQKMMQMQNPNAEAYRPRNQSVNAQYSPIKVGSPMAQMQSSPNGGLHHAGPWHSAGSINNVGPLITNSLQHQQSLLLQTTPTSPHAASSLVVMVPPESAGTVGQQGAGFSATVGSTSGILAEHPEFKKALLVRDSATLMEPSQPPPQTPGFGVVGTPVTGMTGGYPGVHPGIFGGPGGQLHQRHVSFDHTGGGGGGGGIHSSPAFFASGTAGYGAFFQTPAGEVSSPLLQSQQSSMFLPTSPNVSGGSGGPEFNTIFFESQEAVYSLFMKAHKAYDLIPNSSKLVVFDTELPVSKAFYALVYNGVRAAPLWDSAQQQFVGMLTITDFIQILHKYYRPPVEGSEGEKGKGSGSSIGSMGEATAEGLKKLEEHKISTWREIFARDREAAGSTVKPMIVIDPAESLHRAVQLLCDHHIHRLPVLEQSTGNILYILTHKRLIKFLYLYVNDLPKPQFMDKTPRELGIGCFEGTLTISKDTPLIKAMELLLTKRVSALPLVDADGRVVDLSPKT